MKSGVVVRLTKWVEVEVFGFFDVVLAAAREKQKRNNTTLNK